MASTEIDAPRPAGSPASLLPTGLIGLAFVIVAIVFAASSSWYQAFLAVHILFVVIWLGGGAMLTLLGILAERRSGPVDVMTVARMAAFVGERVFAPSGIVVVAMGIAMTLNLHLGFGHFWLVFGLIGFASTFLIGIGVLAPLSKKIAALIEAKGADAPESQAAVAKILLIARLDLAVLLLVVVDMATKPFS